MKHPQSSKNILGKLAYLLDGAKKIPNITSYHMTIECEGTVIEDDFIFGMVTNSNSIGGFKGLNGKNVKLDDGLFEVAFIKMPKNVLELQVIINSLVTRELDSEYIYSFLTDKIIIKSEEEVSWTVDGEYGGTYKYAEIVNHEQAITYRKGLSSSSDV